MARLASPRRRRTLRVTAAGALLTISLLLALTSVALAPDGSAGWASAWVPPVVALALCAALLLHTQLRRERVEHAADRQLGQSPGRRDDRQRAALAETVDDLVRLVHR